MMKYLCTLLLFVIASYGASYAFAFPPLTPYQHASGIAFNIPQGWQVNVDEVEGTVLVFEDANDPSAASLGWFMASAEQGTPEEFIAYFIENTLSNFQVISAEANGTNYYAIAQGQIDGIQAQLAFISFSDASTGLLSLLVFAATPDRFDALGGADLLLVTFGGQSPDSLQTSPSAGNAHTQQGQAGGRQFYVQQSPECFDVNDIFYNLSFCQSIRILAHSVSPSAQAIQGTWGEVTGAPSMSSWLNTTTNQISYDSSGMGIQLIFDNQGRYTIAYRYNITSAGCISLSEGFETGRYQFDPATLQISLVDAQSEVTLTTCGNTSQPFQGETPALQVNVGFGNNGEMVIDMPCRDYMQVGCADNGYRKLLLHRE